MRNKHILLTYFYVLVFILFAVLPVSAQIEDLYKDEDSNEYVDNFRHKQKPYQPITKIDLGVQNLTLQAGETYSFQITYEPEEPFIYALNWFVTNDSVISIDQGTNEITAISPGNARIYAESMDGVSYTICDVVVTGSTEKNTESIKSGADINTISDKDLKKITAKSVRRFLNFVTDSDFNVSSYESAVNYPFMVTAHVVPGTEKAESDRALMLGMYEAQVLKELNLVNLHGTLQQILAFTADNPDLLEIFELENLYLVDPVEEDTVTGKSMNLEGNTEALTSVSTAHNLGLTGKGTAIAVIDTGLNVDHEQFAGRIAAQHCFSKDDVDLINIYSSACDGGVGESDSAKPNAYKPSEFNHGSHVTGIAAGRDGIAPEANIVSVLAFTQRIYRCSIFDRNYWGIINGKTMCYTTALTFQDQLAAYNWLIETQKSFIDSSQPLIIAVNMSYGSGAYDSECDSDNYEVKDAFQKLIDAGMIPVVASGNESMDTEICRPACLSNAFSVGALSDSETPQIASYSNHNELVDILSPGTNIYSALFAFDQNESVNTCETGGNCYGYMSGTSMATPMVTGAFALLKQANPNMSVQKLQETLVEMSTKSTNIRNTGTSFSYSKPVLDFSKIPVTTTAVKMLNSSGTDITGKTLNINSASYQLKAKAEPAGSPQEFSWKSSSTSVATVNANGKVTFKKAGTVTITATAADGSNKSAWVKLTYAPPVENVKIMNSSGTDITGKTLKIKSTSYQLKAAAEPAIASQKFTWKSSNTGIATVDANGKVTFKKSGTVTITATASDGSKKSAAVKLTFTQLATGVTIQNSAGKDITGQTVTTTKANYQLKATATPATAAQEFTWTSSNTGIATVDSNGKVTFKKSGTVTITATAADGSGKSAWVKLTFKQPLASSVKILNSSGTDITGKTVTVNSASYQLKAVAQPAGAAQKFTWTSSSTGIATVDSSGKVTFKKSGTVTITATAADGSGKSAWVKLTFKQSLATAVKIQDPSGTDITGKTVMVSSASYQLKAIAEPAGVLQKFTWTSANTDIATVDENGKVTFKKNGSVKITATTTDGSKKAASVTLTLNRVPLATSVKILNSSGDDVTWKTVTTRTAGYQLKAVATPSGAVQNFTWTSSNTSIATVDANGKVTFLKAGTVKITAMVSDNSRKSASVTLRYAPQATEVKILNPSGTDITGKTVTVNTAGYQLSAEATPAGADQSFTWTSSDTGIAVVDQSGMVTFTKSGTVTITAAARDGSKKSAWVKLKYTKTAEPVNLEIIDTNIRGKNQEIQIVIPWNDGLIKVECTLYDDSTGEEVRPAFRERMDVNGKNRVVSYVGAPLENGKVYRFRIRVYNGEWSNYVEKYAMPISNVYGATVVAGNKTMVINTQHREPSTGTRYMVFDAATEEELGYKLGTRTNTTWTYNQLMNGKLYYVVAVPYRDYKGQRLWGPNQNRIYFIPMGIPAQGKVNFSGSNATVSIASDPSADGIRVLYRPVGGALENGCESMGTECTISGLDRSSAYEFYVMKFKMAEGKNYYSIGTLISYNTIPSGLSAPQNNPVVAMNNSGFTTFTIKKSSNAEGISVLYKIGDGNFQQACEKAGNSCSTTLDISKNYTFYIMQYRTQNGKKLYSPGIVARDYTSGKAPDAERLYTGFTLADGIIDMNEVYDVLDGYMSEESLLLEEAFAVMGADLISKGAEELYGDEDFFDYSGFDGDAPEYDPEAGFEGSFDMVVEGEEEIEDFSMYRFGDSEKPLSPAPSFNNL